MRKLTIATLVIIGICIAPTLYAADLFGIVSDKNANPIETTVSLQDAKGACVGAPVTTDKKGAYAFRDIKPGLYNVVVGEKNVGRIFVGPGETRRDFRLK